MNLTLYVLRTPAGELYAGLVPPTYKPRFVMANCVTMPAAFTQEIDALACRQELEDQGIVTEVVTLTET